MAITKTQTLPPYYVQKLGEQFATFATGAKPITESPFYVDPSSFTGQKFVAKQDQITKDAQDLRGGLGDYTQFLDQAKDLTGIAQQQVVDPITGQLMDAPSAAALGQAGTAIDAGLAAAQAGQGASDPFTAAAQQFVGPQAFQQFMSPYQQQVIDATMAQMQQDAAQQQAQLGAAAGNAFGGSRFGVAQGELAAQNILNQASMAADLRQQGFTQANTLAQQNFANQLALGNQAMNQASQNVGLMNQAGSAQQGLAQAQDQAFANQLSQLGGLSAAQQQLGEYGTTMLGNQINALSQIGTQNQAFQQALLDASKAEAQQKALAKQQGLGFLGQIMGGALGAPGGTVFQTTPDPSTAQTLLGGGIGLLGILGSTGAFNNNQSG